MACTPIVCAQQGKSDDLIFRYFVKKFLDSSRLPHYQTAALDHTISSSFDALYWIHLIDDFFDVLHLMRTEPSPMIPSIAFVKPGEGFTR